jgi:hypothetical protein
METWNTVPGALSIRSIHPHPRVYSRTCLFREGLAKSRSQNRLSSRMYIKRHEGGSRCGPTTSAGHTLTGIRIPGHGDSTRNTACNQIATLGSRKVRSCDSLCANKGRHAAALVRWREKDLNLRRHSQQIYSLPPLTTRESLQNCFGATELARAISRNRTGDLEITSHALYQLS